MLLTVDRIEVFVLDSRTLTQRTVVVREMFTVWRHRLPVSSCHHIRSRRHCIVCLTAAVTYYVMS